MAVVGKGRAATGFAIASAILVAFLFLCYRYFQSFDATLVISISFTMATRQCRRFASLTAALRIPHATHPLPLSFEKERGDTNNFFYYCSPSLTELERGNKKGVSEKREGRYENILFLIVPPL
jgi:hypothetical protein